MPLFSLDFFAFESKRFANQNNLLNVLFLMGYSYFHCIDWWPKKKIEKNLASVNWKQKLLIHRY